MTDLFDWEASRRGKREGMDRAEAGATPLWSIQMGELVEEVAEARQFFTPDDVFRLASTRNIASTHDGRAFGPVMLRAARAGICRKAMDRPFVPSERKSCHCKPMQVWESLIFRST